MNLKNELKKRDYFLRKTEDIECESNDDLKEYYVEKCDIILEYAYKEDITNFHKINMEDKGKSILNYNNYPNQILFCLFDGHGGVKCQAISKKILEK